jgi:TetR/AcrR family transcriptional repressor of mexJK operon
MENLSSTPTAQAEDPNRSARKRKAIKEAASTLFLCYGYQGTSMDQIAGLAAVSKQTVYKNFADKEQLFREIILGITGTVESFISAVSAIQETDDLEKDLTALARRYVRSVMQPSVLQLRRLVISESGRFPELGRAYYDRGPDRVIAALATCLQHLAERGLLHVDDPILAANHFAFLVLSIPLDRAMVRGDDESFNPADLDRFADAGVRVFLAAYGHP